MLKPVFVSAALLVAGRVGAATVTGVVLDQDSRPVAGVVVAARGALSDAERMLAEEERREVPVAGKAVTGKDGRYRLELPAGGYEIGFESARSSRQQLEEDLEENGRDELPPIVLAPAKPLSGTIRDEMGKPIAGALVSVQPLEESSESPGRFVANARSGADGRFRVSDAAKSPGSVIVAAPGFAQYSRFSFSSAIRGPLQVVLRRGGVVSGRILEGNGNPAAGAIVVVGDHAAKTNESGRFRVAGVRAGRASVQAYKEQSAGQEDLVVPEAKEKTVELRLRPTASITGTVVGALDGKPIPGARVTAGEAAVRTDRKGRFRVEAIPAGAIRFEAMKSGFLSWVRFRQVLAPGQKLSIPIRLEPMAALSGKVVDPAGKPVKGALVAASAGATLRGFLRRAAAGGSHADQSSRTDAQGRFELDSVDAGNYQITAEKTGWASLAEPLDVEDTVGGLRLELARSEGITIHAGDARTGAPLGQIRALVFAGNGALAFDGAVALDGEGKGEIPLLPPGGYAGYFFAQGYATSSAAMAVPAPPLILGFTGGGRVEIHAAAEASGATAVLRMASGAAYLSDGSEFTGRFAISAPVTVRDRVYPGVYALVVSLPDGDHSYAVAVQDGQTSSVAVP